MTTTKTRPVELDLGLLHGLVDDVFAGTTGWIGRAPATLPRARREADAAVEAIDAAIGELRRIRRQLLAQVRRADKAAAEAAAPAAARTAAPAPAAPATQAPPAPTRPSPASHRDGRPLVEPGLVANLRRVPAELVAVAQIVLVLIGSALARAGHRMRRAARAIGRWAADRLSRGGRGTGRWRR